jgi:hypothetical protein
MKIEEIEKLEIGWNDNDPIPDRESIIRAKNIISWLENNKVIIDDIDPDVLGGISIVAFNSNKDYQVWFSILNSGDSIVESYNYEVQSHNLTDETKALILSKLLS